MKLDWGDGAYEETGRELLPAAEELVRLAAPLQGERVVDIGCGTGNAALAAARQGALVTAVDPSPRLLEVTARRAHAEGLDIETVQGEAAALGVADGAFDVATASFSIIFAADAAAAAAGLLGALRPGGRGVVSTWVTSGAIHAASNLLLDAMKIDASSPWHEIDSARALFTRHGARVEVSEGSLVFAAPSAEAWFAAKETDHPFWRLARGWFVNNDPDGYQVVRAAIIDTLTRSSESESALRITSGYRLLHVQR